MELFECVATVEDLDDVVERLGAVGDDHGVTVQAFDARAIVDRTHLERAVALADRALARGENVARDRAVEILCFAAGRRQISRALSIGVDAGECPAVVLVDEPPAEGAAHDRPVTDRAPAPATDAERAAVATLASMPELAPAETLGGFDADRVRDVFDVSEAELATVDGDLAPLVHERVALLAVER